jgi:AcrR family transcriptional regulator
MSGDTRPDQPSPSIWTRPERASRGPSPEHSRAEIAAAGVALADAQGLAAVTMRSVAAAIGTAPASLYRYVRTRGELVQLMADHVYGEFSYDEPEASGQPAGPEASGRHAGPGPADPTEDLLRIARQGRAVYRRHPWLLDVTATESLPGPNAVAFIEHALAALSGTSLSGSAKLETVGLFSGALRLVVQTEIGQQLAGQSAAEWQESLAAYLVAIAADGQHPHLAAALADPASPDSGPARSPSEALFDRAMTRILAGLLAPPGL